MSDYKNTWRRFEKIKATMEQLLVENISLREKLRKRDEPLVAKVNRLQASLSAKDQQIAAQERVLKSITLERDRLKGE